MPLPLLQTKLYAPPPRAQLVQRAHVIAQLRNQARRPLTLVSAPAGFGKTTLVSAWLAQTTQAVAWLALDDDDNDPTRFFTYVIAALQTHQPEIGASAQALLTTPQMPPPKAILTLLLNELDTLAAPLTLVLDDYHLIMTPAIHEALAYLIDHLPPSFDLVITTRIDPPLPLARWRARNQLTEIRADELRFLTDEATSFLNEVMGLQLTEQQIAALETRTEGWIAGLQLAALSMQGRKDLSGFIQAFAGSHRHVLSYLSEEVLNRHPQGILDFLLQTSILDRLSAPLCDAVTARSDSQQLLELVEQANLFLIPLDDMRVWYRYHHLFADVLRVRLHHTFPQLVQTLYHRASAWCAYHDQLPEAIQYALASQDYQAAADLIERFKITFSPDPALQARLNQWLHKLPDEVVQAHPRLCAIHAWLLFAQFDVEQALRRVVQAEAALQQHPYADPDQTRSVGQEIRAIDALLTAYAPKPDYAKTIAVGEQVLATAAPHLTGVRNLAAGALAAAYVKQGQLARAQAVLAQAVQRAQAAQELYMVVVTGINLALAQRAAGALRNAIATCRQALDWMATQAPSTHPMLGALYATLADLLRELNDLQTAAAYASEGVAACDRWAHPAHMLLSRFVLLRVKQAQGDWDGVWALWQEIAQRAQQRRALPAPFLAVARVQLLLNQGRTKEALPWFDASSWQEAMPSTIVTTQEFVYTYEYNRVVRAQVALAHARASADSALLHELSEHLLRQGQAAEREGLLWLRIKVGCLQALASAALGAKEQAIGALRQAIILAEPAGFLRVFVDEGELLRVLIADLRAIINEPRLRSYLDRLLAAFGGSKAAQSQLDPAAANMLPDKTSLYPFERLSERELEVLHLLAKGLSNSQIAARLVVTTGTIKTHINHIFGKLAVQSRTQAIVRARELGLDAN